uniref:Uncharacterized protein n=1 Tax=Steinernema glaseri TaxID=37863 RepID=A0A1I7Y4W2_9BILA
MKLSAKVHPGTGKCRSALRAAVLARKDRLGSRLMDSQGADKSPKIAREVVTKPRRFGRWGQLEPQALGVPSSHSSITADRGGSDRVMDPGRGDKGAARSVMDGRSEDRGRRVQEASDGA